MCLDVRDFELATPDAWERIFTFTRWLCEHGCRFNGSIVKNTLVEKLTNDAMEKWMFYYEYRAFSDPDTCLAWCKKKAAEL